jgi:AcrR family transcriptional regulator
MTQEKPAWRGVKIDPATRRNQILQAAIDVAARDGITGLVRLKVAQVALVAPALVSHYFGSMQELKDAIMRQAVEDSIVSIVSQGLALGDPIAQASPQALKDLAAAHLAA